MKAWISSRRPCTPLVIAAGSAVAAWIIALGLTGTAQAQPAGANRPARPPAEALDACKSATSGQACSFTPAGGSTLSGTCGAPRQGIPLACRPANGKAPEAAASRPGR